MDLDGVERQVSEQCAALPCMDVACQALSHSSIISVSGQDEAIKLSNPYAPEHLNVSMGGCRGLAAGVGNAGSLFLGR